MDPPETHLHGLPPTPDGGIVSDTGEAQRGVRCPRPAPLAVAVPPPLPGDLLTPASLVPLGPGAVVCCTGTAPAGEDGIEHLAAVLESTASPRRKADALRQAQLVSATSLYLGPQETPSECAVCCVQCAVRKRVCGRHESVVAAVDGLTDEHVAVLADTLHGSPLLQDVQIYGVEAVDCCPFHADWLHLRPVVLVQKLPSVTSACRRWCACLPAPRRCASFHWAVRQLTCCHRFSLLSHDHSRSDAPCVCVPVCVPVHLCVVRLPPVDSGGAGARGVAEDQPAAADVVHHRLVFAFLLVCACTDVCTTAPSHALNLCQERTASETRR